MRTATIAGLAVCATLGVAALVVLGLPLLSTWPLVFLGGLAAAAPFVVALMRGRFDVFEPVYLFAVAYAILFVVRPVADLLTQAPSPVIFGYVTGDTYQQALLVGLVGAVGFYAGYYSGVGRRLGERVPLSRAPLPDDTLRWGVTITLVIAVALFALFLVTGQGQATLAAVLPGRSTRALQSYQDSSGYFYSGLLWLTGPAVLLLATTPRWLSRRGLVGFGLLMASQVLALTHGSRSWFLAAACSVGILWYLKRQQRPSLRSVVGVGAVLFLIGVVVPAQYRNVESRSGSLVDAVAGAVTNPAQGIGDVFQGADTAMVDDLAVELQFVPSVLDYQRGATYLGDAATPIPRGLWPDKPVVGDTLLMQTIWPKSARAGVGYTFSFFGEPYLNLGFVGVAIICAAMGAAWRILYSWFARDDMATPQVMAIFALSWPILFVYVRGSLGASYPRQVIALLPVVVIIVVAEWRRRHAWVPDRQSVGVVDDPEGAQRLSA